MEPLAGALLPWFAAHRRDLSFRRTRDPYAVLLSEIILQRTRVASGIPYYERFLARFPTVGDLAAAREEEVLRAWEGLGFYGRARNLHRAARAIVSDHGGVVPGSFESLRSLPGIGAYTAGAVASIAFGERVPAVDGNATRVLARVFRLGGDLSRREGRRGLWEIAASLVPARDPGAYNQALMELGSTVCRPRAPRCPACPLRGICGAYRHGDPDEYPESAPRRKVPEIRVAFALIPRGGEVLLVRRPPGGLLAGLWSLPGGELRPGETDADGLRRTLGSWGLRVRVLEAAGTVRHGFSHRRWRGRVYRAHPSARVREGDGVAWVGRDRLRDLPVVPFHRRFLEATAFSPRGPSRLL